VSISFLDTTTKTCNCPYPMLLDANGNCYFQQSCGRACILCSSTAPNTCIGCVSHATLNSGQCTCNSGYFLDTVNNICRQCYTTCATCTSYTVSGCLTCRDTTRSTLSGGQCICSSGWFMDLSTGLCAPCHPPAKLAVQVHTMGV
jgi:proprotein convertase subtilisin/kexin type 5